jgi:sortase A
VGVVVIGLTYGPLILQEFNQFFRSKTPIPEVYLTKDTFDEKGVVPIDTDFGIVIPKIGANSSVIADVDPNNPVEYQQALTQGVAHAKGSVLPGKLGTVFLFAHSSVNFLEAGRYNSIFYLLHWLKPTDDVDIFYQNEHYRYRVTEVTYADPSEVEYLYQYQPEERLVLMTCWPPGTTMKRLIVVCDRLPD